MAMPMEFEGMYHQYYSHQENYLHWNFNCYYTHYYKNIG